MNALDIYKSLSQPPKTALRPINDGNLKGKTDINPQWRYEAMTEKFGLVGLGWKYEVQKLWTEQGAGSEILAFAQVAVFVRDPETKEWSDPIVGIGGSKLINDFQRGPKSNDEGYKMAVTDAFSTSLKMLGVAADIYAGRWDGSKYNNKDEDITPATKNQPKPAKAQPQKAPQGPAGGPDTPEEHARINQLLSAKYQDGTKIFNQADVHNITSQRATKTAGDVILLLNQEIRERTAARTPVVEGEVENDPGYYEMKQAQPATEPIF